MIKFGHSFSEIQDYSYGQIKLFLESILEIEKRQRQVNLIDSAIAAQGDEKTIRKAIQEL